eukprot:366210-Chlamydomonas_euryale.AAC.6
MQGKRAARPKQKTKRPVAGPAGADEVEWGGTPCCSLSNAPAPTSTVGPADTVARGRRHRRARRRRRGVGRPSTGAAGQGRQQAAAGNLAVHHLPGARKPGCAVPRYGTSQSVGPARTKRRRAWVSIPHSPHFRKLFLHRSLPFLSLPPPFSRASAPQPPPPSPPLRTYCFLTH